MGEITPTVKDKLSDEIYEKLAKLQPLEFRYGEIFYFDKDNIEEGQEGFRYNPIKQEVIEDWTGDEYVIIGHDESIGDGPDPIIIKIDDPKLPVFYFATEYEDWSKPTQIANSLDDYIAIMDKIAQYADDIADTNLSEENFKSLMEEIGKLNTSSYWNGFLEKAVVGYYDQFDEEN